MITIGTIVTMITIAIRGEGQIDPRLPKTATNLARLLPGGANSAPPVFSISSLMNRFLRMCVGHGAEFSIKVKSGTAAELNAVFLGRTARLLRLRPFRHTDCDTITINGF